MCQVDFLYIRKQTQNRRKSFQMLSDINTYISFWKADEE